MSQIVDAHWGYEKMSEFKDRMRQEGRVSEWRKLRTDLRKSGVPGWAAGRIAVSRFQPEGRFIGVTAGGGAFFVPTLEQIKTDSYMLYQPAAETQKKGEFEETGQVVLIPDKDVNKCKQLAIYTDKKKQPHAAVRGGRPKRVTSRAISDWVANHLSSPKASPSDAPCPAAWDLLEWCRKSSGNTGEFWLKIWAKNLGVKSDIDEEIDRLGDDGRKVLSVIDELTVAGDNEGYSVLLYGAEGDSGEPELAEESTDEGSGEWEES